MTAMARHFDDLGPDFDLRWKHTTRAHKRELIGELRDLYIFLEEEDMPLLASATLKPHGAFAATTTTAVPAKASQGMLFSDAGTEAEIASTEIIKPSPAAAPRKENPFLPKSVLDKLQASQSQTSAGLRELMQSTLHNSPVSHEQVDLERELRLKLGPMVESLIEAQMEMLKSELRVRLRTEMDKMIAEHVRKN
jgi:hypothetical protein